MIAVWSVQWNFSQLCQNRLWWWCSGKVWNWDFRVSHPSMHSCGGFVLFLCCWFPHGRTGVTRLHIVDNLPLYLSKFTLWLNALKKQSANPLSVPYNYRTAWRLKSRISDPWFSFWTNALAAIFVWSSAEADAHMILTFSLVGIQIWAHCPSEQRVQSFSCSWRNHT